MSVEVRSEIARLEAEGYRPTAIARSLNARNIPTRRATQRRHTHLMRNYLTNVPKASQSMVATLVRTIFEVQPDPERVWAQHARVAPNETTELQHRITGKPPIAAAPNGMSSHSASPDDGARRSSTHGQQSHMVTWSFWSGPPGSRRA